MIGMMSIQASIIRFGILLPVLVLSSYVLAADEVRDEQETVELLKEMSFEDLLNVEVTSVSKKKESLFEAPAAVYVITQEDIRRSGATSIPELLRMVPGIEVARLNGNIWAISVRGFNGIFSHKLLVLIDGRAVYTPIFSGVRWESRDTFIEDIERIEIIRGPGATLWGANAVNGVINIITKDASDTEGGLLTIGAGNEEKLFGGIRYGSKSKNGTHWRVYSKYFDWDGFVDDSGRDMNDDWDSIRCGFRVDRLFSDGDHLTIQGDIFDVTGIQNVTFPRVFPPVMATENTDLDLYGGNLLARWTFEKSEDSEYTFQAYYDFYSRETEFSKTELHTIDLDMQNRLKISDRQELLWGLGYRLYIDDIENSYIVSFDPDSRTSNVFNAFIQDSFELIDDKLRLTFGTKLEYNDFSGLEIQPTIRLSWMPAEQHTLWAAVSRAVQTPSRSFQDIRLNIIRFPLGLISILGNDDVDSEELLAFEIGYRFQATEKLMFDLTFFYNLYDELRTAELTRPRLELRPGLPHILIPLEYENKMEGDVAGFELAMDWRPTNIWRLAASYSYLNVDLDLDSSSTDILSSVAEGSSPRHQVSLRSYLNLPHNVKFDTSVAYVDNLSALDVPSYVRVDARLAWMPGENLEISIVGQNLFDNHHIEYGGFNEVNPNEPERSIFGKIKWEF